jgi:hypothetical protein
MHVFKTKCLYMYVYYSVFISSQGGPSHRTEQSKPLRSKFPGHFEAVSEADGHGLKSQWDFILHTQQFTLLTSHSPLHTSHFTLSHSSLNTAQFPHHTTHSPLHTPFSTLPTLPFTLHIFFGFRCLATQSRGVQVVPMELMRNTLHQCAIPCTHAKYAAPAHGIPS